MDKILKRMRPLLGTFVEIGLDISKNPHADEAFNQAFEVVEKIQNLLSFHDLKSELSKLNLNPRKEVYLDPHSAVVLRLARSMMSASGGLFNFMVGGKLIQEKVLPNLGGENPIAFGEAQDLQLKGRRACLVRPVRITVDGIAKGYAVDQAVKKLTSFGFESGWVNAGGDLRIFGQIKLPLHRREADGRLTYLGEFSNQAIATSKAGPKIDPEYPGYIVSPLKQIQEARTWSISSSCAWRADALTKVAALASDQDRESLIRRLGGRLILT